MERFDWLLQPSSRITMYQIALRVNNDTMALSVNFDQSWMVGRPPRWLAGWLAGVSFARLFRFLDVHSFNHLCLSRICREISCYFKKFHSGIIHLFVRTTPHAAYKPRKKGNSFHFDRSVHNFSVSIHLKTFLSNFQQNLNSKQHGREPGRTKFDL